MISHLTDTWTPTSDQLFDAVTLALIDERSRKSDLLLASSVSARTAETCFCWARRHDDSDSLWRPDRYVSLRSVPNEGKAPKKGSVCREEEEKEGSLRGRS